MATVNKIVTGFVIQQFDSKTSQFISQEFVAGDEVVWEFPDGETADNLNCEFPYIPYEMYN